uniref:Ig-like domain-containing protein n=1 Tax=Pavo cristatus TaxID=9049 RepID=A0A8C9FTV8_PAVCR
MELRVILLLLLCCPGLRAQTPETEMSQREGSTFSIQCPYTTQPDNKQLKAWCRVRNARCELVAWKLASMQYIYSDRARQGHITIQDDNRTVSITMSDLQAEDSGMYSCVYSSNYVPLKTILLNVYKELHKRELDSLSVQCPYRALGYSEGRKAWCRQQGQAECSLIVSTAYPYTWSSTGARNKSSSIQDDAQTGIATITMNKLQAQDSGVYWCALYNPYQRPAFTRIMEVRLSVDKSLRAQTPETEMSQREGSTFSIQCPYTTQPDNKQLKAWCRMRNARCELLVLTLASREYQYSDRARQGHITIQDDNRTVSITMSDLQAEDSGIYSCMYSSNYVPLKTILLNVYKELHKRELDSLSVQCPYRALGYSEGRKAWCRQQGQAECSLIVSTAYPYTWGSTGARNKSSSIQDDAQTGIATITMNKLQAQDSGVYWCALYNPYQRPAFTRIMEVRLSVDKIPAATTLSVTTGSSQKNSSGNSTQPRNTIIISVVLCILLILALAITTLCIRQHKKLRTGGIWKLVISLESTERMGRTTDESRDLNYITLDFKPQLSSDEPLYCNIELSQAPRKPEDENVEYVTITHKQLPKNDKGWSTES